MAPLRAGVEHGVVCIGCCWATVAALLALGLMSIAWMAVIAGVIAAEKLLPRRRAATRAAVVGLEALAIAVVFLPGHLLAFASTASLSGALERDHSHLVDPLGAAPLGFMAANAR